MGITLIILCIVAGFLLLSHIACFVTSVFVDKNREHKFKNFIIIKRLISILLLIASIVLIITSIVFMYLGTNIYDPDFVSKLQQTLIICLSISMCCSVFGSGFSFI